jgi:hypothetical protein
VGIGYAKRVGFDTILERCRLATESLPNGLVDAGFSIGVRQRRRVEQS